ncbi:type VI secretion system membrane subunit TssM [Microbulbifer agarilyticus]|uniref:type VI secretion system membrane subunit TssM n=1 Tax=Microbulbifer agarilyticus TaxID=260552 RepID=UPI001C957FF5|nr:type VI secretion system membrane subunit TssM [Microbulbifer agarilyticus]MBY6189989.1 type VI secretion system membrane subunit TssM [Microbulbifer agarilyticus]
MKRLANFFSNKWVLGLIGLSALSLLIWFGAGYIKFGSDNATLSKGPRLVIIVFLFTIWFVWNLAQWLVERRQNQALIESIESSREDPAKDPDQARSEEELHALSDRFRDAMKVLRKARFHSERGQVSLYQLPWYIIIGPPGSGKTTALANSGLEFPLEKSHGKEALGGVGGTRNCDWWFTNDAVMIDTAGRYTTQDSHRVHDNSAWKAFLSLLQKYRRRRPINGVLVAISLQDLMVQSTEQRMHQAKTIRARVNELQQQLGIRFPIYLTFTKCDLVAGFCEFFDNLSQAERGQVWGISFPEESSPGDGAPLDEFAGEFRSLIGRLNQRVLWRVNQERNIEKRALLQGFPARMESLQNVLSDFLRQAFSSNRYDTVPLLRGVYFSSGTQEGSPIDRMMASVSADFNLEREVAPKFQGAGKSYFLNRLLKDVVFPEAELVGVNRNLERVTRWLRSAVYAASAAVFVGAMFLWTGSLAQNKLYMGEVADNIQDFEKLQSESLGRPVSPIVTLPQLDHLYTAAQVYQKEEHPWLNNLGLYDDRVDRAADALYREQLNSLFLPALQTTIERDLVQMGSADPALVPTLKTYLMLFDDEKRDLDVLQTYFAEVWTKQLSGQAIKQESLRGHLRRLLTGAMPAGRMPDDQVVAGARQQLRRIPVPQRLYGQLQRSEIGQTYIDLYSDVGGDTQQLFGIDATSARFQIPYLYTKAGYKELDFGADSELLQQLAQERWIYGSGVDGEDFSEADREKLGDEVKRIYLAEYHQRWRDFLDGFSLTRFSSTTDALAVLSKLADPVYSPLLAIAEITSDNTQLTARPAVPLDANGVPLPVSSTTRRLGAAAVAGAANALTDQYSPNLVDVRFEELHRLTKSEKGRPARVQEYLIAIAQVHDYLTEIDGGVDASEAAFNKAKARFSGASDAIKQLHIKASKAPAPFDNWLKQVADNSWALVMAKAKGHVDRAWREQVYSVYSRSLANRFPLQSRSELETPVMLFNEYFKPGGVEQQFVNEYLKPFIDTRSWKPRSLEGRSLGISSSSLTQLQRAEIIRKTLFAQGEEAGYGFRIEPTKLDSGVRLFTLELGNQRVPYSHGPRTTSNLDWRGGQSNRARIIFEDLNQTVHRQHFEGDWAWYRLLGNTEMQRGRSNNEYLLTFREEGRSAQFRVRSSSAYNPFDWNLLAAYRCPQVL